MRALPLALLCLPLLATPRALAQEALPEEEVHVESALQIAEVYRGGRSPVFTDAVEARLVREGWFAPEEEAEVELPDGSTRTWEPVECPRNEAGWYEAPGLRGGYWSLKVRSDRDRVVMLRVRGARHLYLRGEPRIGDVYGSVPTSLPVELDEGTNHLLFKSGRGSLRARFSEPPAEVFLEARDATLPHVIRGEGGIGSAGIMAVNATDSWRAGHFAVARVAGGEARLTALPYLPPLSTRKMAVELELPADPESDEVQVEVDLCQSLGNSAMGATTVLSTLPLKLEVRGPLDKHRRTFVSGIDGSVQYYGVTPAHPPEGAEEPPALFLSLHGAGVEAMGQASCYAHKDWGTVVAPTNRRPFGFDWEDWGRLDAMEVLERAEALFGTDPRRTYLTGHSMGGHGTWILGVQFPGRFAAIAPSAGWRDFWSYVGGRQWEDPTPMQALLLRAANGSLPLLLEQNLIQRGVYVLHGDRDDNVPVSQARFMRERLALFHPNWAYYERPGAGHWWGNACMDWEPLFEFLERNRLPEDERVHTVEFRTVNPAISSSCHWVRIEAQIRSMEVSRVRADIDCAARRIDVESENAAALTLDLSDFTRTRPPAAGDERGAALLPGTDPIAVEIDGTSLETPTWPWGAGEDEPAVLRLSRGLEGNWSLAARDPSHKGPLRAGPFKDAFRNRMVFVYGAEDSPEENTWALSKASYDAETFWYRGSGSVDVLSEDELDLGSSHRGRNLILYGNADTFWRWKELLPDCPIEPRRGSIRFRYPDGTEKVLEGDDLACLFIYPRPDDPESAVAVIAGTGPAGMRLTHQLPYFVSGVAYPDWTVIGAEMLEEGSDGVRAAGFFGNDWSLDPEDEAWRDR